LPSGGPSDLCVQISDKDKVDGKMTKFSGIKLNLNKTLKKVNTDISFYHDNNDCPTCKQEYKADINFLRDEFNELRNELRSFRDEICGFIRNLEKDRNSKWLHFYDHRHDKNGCVYFERNGERE
jgi:hypothetical protein